MKISVVTISFNQAEFLEACLDSVAAQAGPWEHIIVDPGSSDGSRDIIERRKRQFSHVILGPDSGPADGLNKGFREAAGDVFFYLNSDDIVLPNAFAEVRRILESAPKLDVVSGSAYIIDDKGRLGRRLWSDPVSRMGLANGGSIQIQPSTYIRRCAFERTRGFNVENRSNWDGELIVDLVESGATFRQVGRVWSGYRLHAASITGSASLDANVRSHSARMHQRLIGKPPGKLAPMLSQYFRVMRILRHPSILYERARFGRIYGGLN